MKLGMLMAAAAVAAIAAGTCVAETIVVGDDVAVRESAVARPDRGTSMTAVEARFGQPANRHSAVGQPPITRWDYPGFAVYFEHQYVIHAVVPSS